MPFVLQTFFFTGGVHKNEEHFENAQQFDPSRFIGSDGQFVPSSKIFYFGLGKRRCPGEILARSEVTNIIIFHGYSSTSYS